MAADVPEDGAADAEGFVSLGTEVDVKREEFTMNPVIRIANKSRPRSTPRIIFARLDIGQRSGIRD